MIEVSIYKLATGEIVKSGIFPDEENLLANVGVDEGTIPNIFDGTKYYVHNGQAVEYPEKSCPECVWDGTQWVDPRTETDWNNELYARREVASISRAEFIIRCIDFGVFDKNEGRQAASGTITPTMQSIIDDMPVEEQFQAEVIWASSSTIFRTNQLIINMAATIFIDEWTLDEVFGVEWPEPLPSWPPGKLHP